MGVVKTQGKADHVSLNNFKLGDNYINMLSEGLSSQNIKKFSLSGNRITERGANSLLNSISKKTKEIEIDKNRIGKFFFIQENKAAIL